MKFSEIFNIFRSKKTTVPTTQPTESVQASMLRSARPSARAHDDFSQAQIDVNNNMLVTETERSRIRAMCKKEYLDNPLARNIARNFTMGVYGPGPVLQIHSDDERINDVIESVFARWREATQLDWKFITAIQSLFYDGEAFLHFFPNPGKPGGIDIELLEARRVTEPHNVGFDVHRLEGITYNDYNEPVWYDVLEENQNPNYLELPQTTIVPATHIMHLFFEDVVNQKRGLPLLQSALEMLASLRRITDASLGAWELAAKMNLIIQTGMDAYNLVQCVPEDFDSSNGEVFAVEPFRTMPVPKDGGMTFLASGMTMNQVHSEHPTQQYSEHTETFQKIAGLSGGLPENLSTGSSAKYNFASAKMDYQLFSRYAGACQQKLKRFLDKCLFLSVASLQGSGNKDVDTFLDLYPVETALPTEWHFSNMLSSIDRSANASGDVQLLQAGLLTHREYCKRYGLDYEAHMADWIEETKRINEVKIPETPTVSTTKNETGNTQRDD